MKDKKKLPLDKVYSVIGTKPREQVKAVVKEMTVGKPVSISDIPLRQKGGRTLDHWLEICKQVPEGFAQQVRGYSLSAARSAIDRLIKLGLIPSTFIVRGRGPRKSPKIFIIHLKSAEEGER